MSWKTNTKGTAHWYDPVLKGIAPCGEPISANAPAAKANVRHCLKCQKVINKQPKRDLPTLF